MSNQVDHELLNVAKQLVSTIRAKEQENEAKSKRVDPRYGWCMPLTIHVMEPSSGPSEGVRRPMDVVTFDISQSGFSFIARAYMHRGTIVHAMFDFLDVVSEITGVVRYCIHIGDTMHRVGVQFTDVKRD